MAANHETRLENTTQSEARWQRPKMFRVVMHNDDYTTMDFVVDVLTGIFHKNKIEATNIMTDVHNSGKGVAGVYTYDIAVTKKIQTDRVSHEKGFPLKVTVDEEED